MNIEIINSLKERAKEMLKNNYDRKIEAEEIYTIIVELENFYTAYEKEKEKNKELSDKLTEKICKGVEEEILEEYRQVIIDKDKIIEELKKYKK